MRKLKLSMDVQKVTSNFVRLTDVLTFTVWALNFSFGSCQPWVKQVHQKNNGEQNVSFQANGQEEQTGVRRGIIRVTSHPL